VGRCKAGIFQDGEPSLVCNWSKVIVERVEAMKASTEKSGAMKTASETSIAATQTNLTQPVAVSILPVCCSVRV
jgi:hypothetical protein